MQGRRINVLLGNTDKLNERAHQGSASH
jgi:hypothetical protein